MPIVNAKADEVLKAFLREKVNGRSLKLRSNPADRLVGSFIWNWAVALTGKGAQDQGMTSAAAHDRVAIELPQVFQFIQDVLGTDRRRELVPQALSQSGVTGGEERGRCEWFAELI